MERLYRENYQRIYRYCYGKLEGSRVEAEDCAMEVFVRGYEKARELMHHPCPEKWLYLTARHVTQERYRQRLRTLRRELPAEGEVLCQLPADQGIPGQILEEPGVWAEDLQHFLKPKEQELFQLVFLEERPLGEVAQLLGIRYTNVTTRVHRLRRKLQKILQKKKPAEGGNQMETLRDHGKQKLPSGVTGWQENRARQRKGGA